MDAYCNERKFYKLGDSTKIIREIRRGFSRVATTLVTRHRSVFTKDLEDAVKSFQQTRGLKEDGIIGRALINELNIPAAEIIEKIVLNMERSRWVPVRLAGDYLVVNIPAFKLYVYRNDSLQWDMNIVAGKPLHETVIFNGDLKYIVFSPYWNVPQSIFQNEILTWNETRSRLPRKAQHGEGRKEFSSSESLGQIIHSGKVKFLFPNSYNIYLHDTPSKSLFNKTSRAFSHGCIRLGEPKKLAMYLLRDDPELDLEKSRSRR